MSIAHLHDDVLLYLAKHFVSDKDCLSLALSGVNERFTFLFGDKRTRLVISQCYFIGPDLWKELFQNITPSLISVFDVSHCYWLPAETILHSLLEMVNLQELSIEDTKMSLANLPQVFQACQKIVKFSFSLLEKNLDQYQEGVMDEVSLDSLKNGFGRVTHLKIFTFITLIYDNRVEPWLVTLGVLKWCRDCTDLLIKVIYTYTGKSRVPRGCLWYFGIPHTNKEIERTVSAREEFVPHLAWMKNLKSLVILRNDPGTFSLIDYFIREFFDWFKDYIQKDSPNSLERLWITEDDLLEANYDYVYLQLNGTSIKSCVWDKELFKQEHYPAELNDERFQHLEHIADVYFNYNPLEHLLNLKYARGDCGFSNADGFNQFCEAHPKLEQLHFLAPLEDPEEDAFFGQGGWKLLLLKILVYRCENLSQRVMDYLIEACPNIDQLHIDFFLTNSEVESVNLIKSIRFERLTWLTISVNQVYNGSYLPSIIQNCPMLERLYLTNNFGIDSPFFRNLERSLPNAVNLRDLRLEWSLGSDGGVTDCLKILLKTLLKCYARFERLVLYIKPENCDWDLISHATAFANFLVSFVKKMTHLVALCFAGFPIDPDASIHRRLAEEIIPFRPAFWFHLGPELPKANDTSVPRIHYDEIINPIDPYDAPPQF